jgi:hypothetical protein
VRENAFDQLPLLDARDHFEAPAAARALLDLDPEHALQAPCPFNATCFRVDRSSDRRRAFEPRPAGVIASAAPP